MTVPGSKSGTNRRFFWRPWPKEIGGCWQNAQRRLRSLGGARRLWVFAVSKLSMVGKCMALAGDSQPGAPWSWAMVGLQLVSCWRPRPFVPSRSPSMDQHDCVNAQWAMAFAFWNLSGPALSGLARRGIFRCVASAGSLGERSRSVKSHPANFSLPRCWWRLGQPRVTLRCTEGPPRAVPSHDHAGVGRSGS